MQELDLALISGDFAEYSLPKQKQYLLKYFDSEIQNQFIRYYVIFGSVKHFTDHTGIFCKKRWLKYLVSRFHEVEAELKRAKSELDFATVALIESGRYKFRD